MNFIPTTNIVFNFIIFQERQIYISLFLSFFLLLIIIYFKKSRINYLLNKNEQNKILIIKEKYLKLVSELDINNKSFFYELNLLLRSFLEDYKKFPGITKMTKNEILAKDIKSGDFRLLLEDCEKFEFGDYMIISNEIKFDSKNKALQIIKKI